MATAIKTTRPDPRIHRRQSLRLGKTPKINRHKKLGGIQGKSLKRPPRGYDAEARHIDSLKRKSFFIMAAAEPELALGPDFITESTKVFRTTAKLNHFITDALDLQF